MNGQRPAVATSSPGRLRSSGWFVAALVVELVLYASYQGEDGRFHWFTHFFVGAAFALVTMALVARAKGRPVRLPFVWLLLGHLVAMAPDFAFVEGVAHGRWMDVFLGHVSSHYILGRNWTWFAVFLVALGAYLVVIDWRSWEHRPPLRSLASSRTQMGHRQRDCSQPPPGRA